MSPSQTIRSLVTATAHEVLPKFGLAFLVDDHETTWAITRNMAGLGLESLRAGQRVQLTLDHQSECSVVRAYEPQNWRRERRPPLISLMLVDTAAARISG